MKLIFNFILLLIFSNCSLHRPGQVLMKRDNPMPNEIRQNGPIQGDPSRINITNIQNGKFRDSSIHIGNESSVVLDFHGGQGQDAIALLNLSALPHKDMLNTEISKWDLNNFNIVYQFCKIPL